MHRIAVVAVPPLNTFDLAIPGLIFGGVEVGGQPAYDIRVCTAEPGVLASDTGLDVYVPDGLEAVDDAETVMVTGGAGRDAAPTPPHPDHHDDRATALGDRPALLDVCGRQARRVRALLPRSGPRVLLVPRRRQRRHRL